MFDLAVPEAALAGDGARVLGMLVRFGFRGIAISVTSDGNLNKSKIDRSKYAAMLEKAAGDAVVPRASPPLLAQANSDLPRSLAATTFDLFTRLSVVLDNPSHNYSISSGSPIVASYDILAVHPKTEKLFQAACQQLEVDIVSLDMGSRLPFHLRHPTINAAIQRGVHFEICYAPAIRDSTARRHIISNSAALMRATKGRNIVLSSELVQAFDLRGPHDIANLAALFSMNQAQAMAALTTNVRAVLLHAATRRDTYRAVMSMEASGIPGAPGETPDDHENPDARPGSAARKWKAARLEDQDFISFDDLGGDEDPMDM